MTFFKSLLALSFLALGNVQSAASTPTPCVVLQPGNYMIESAALPGELLRPGSSDPSTVEFILLEKTAPQGQLGVWTLTNADQSGYHIMNVALGRNVTTVHLVESGLFLADVDLVGTPATTYAIQCAGNGEYVIKNVTADQLWGTDVGTGLGDPEGGLARIQLLPASGSIEQHFLFHEV